MTTFGTPTTRRGFLTGALGLGAAAALAACGDTASSPASPPSAGTAFHYTDGRGKAVTLPKIPTRIVAQVGVAASLWDFGIRPIGVFGPSKKADGSQDPQSGSVDLSKVTSVGNVYGEFNIEKYLSLQPEVLISSMLDPKLLWYVPEESQSKIEQIAPAIGVQLTQVDLLDGIQKFADLAALLGADLRAPAVTAAKAAFDKADGELKTAAAAATAAGLRVGAFSCDKDKAYLAVPANFPDLKHYLAQGTPLTVPGKPDAANAWWESLSWENVGKYPLDVILYDTRTQALPNEELRRTVPAWAALPAVRNNQIIDWYSEAQLSYQGYAPRLADVAAKLATFKKIA
jgi:iron complex transport system substrate-binding protein